MRIKLTFDIGYWCTGLEETHVSTLTFFWLYNPETWVLYFSNLQCSSYWFDYLLKKIFHLCLNAGPFCALFLIKLCFLHFGFCMYQSSLVMAFTVTVRLLSMCHYVKVVLRFEYRPRSLLVFVLSQKVVLCGQVLVSSCHKKPSKWVLGAKWTSAFLPIEPLKIHIRYWYIENTKLENKHLHGRLLWLKR